MIAVQMLATGVTVNQDLVEYTAGRVHVILIHAKTEEPVLKITTLQFLATDVSVIQNLME